MKLPGRRIFLFLLLAAICALAVQQWLAASSAWACDQQATCRSTVALDLEALEFDGAIISWRSFDLSPDGSEVTVALLTSESPIRNDDRLLIGTFSTASGELISTLVREELVDFVAVDEVRYSPDGSLVAAVWFQSRGQLDVFDAATGELVNTIFQTEGRESIFCDGVLGLSAANDEVQCGSVIFDRASGERVGGSAAGLLAVKSGGSQATSFSGLFADGFGRSEIEVSRRSTTSTEPIVEIEPLPFDSLDRSLLAFGESAAGTEHLVLLEDADRWRWWSASPRRLHPEARVSVYSPTTGTLEWSSELADRTSALAVNDEGLTATISTDGVVTIFDLA